MKLLFLFLSCLFCVGLFAQSEETFDPANLENLVPEVVRTDRKNNVMIDIVWQRGNVTKLIEAGIGKIGIQVNAGRTTTHAKKEIARFFANILGVSVKDISMRTGKTEFHKGVVVNKKAISPYNAMEKIMEAIDQISVDTSSSEAQENKKQRSREMDRIMEAVENIKVD